MGHPTSFEQNAARVTVLTAIQQMTKLLPPKLVNISGSATLVYSDSTNKARAHAGPAGETRPMHVGSAKPVSRNHNQEQVTTLGDMIHIPSPAWSYNSNWSDDLSPPGRNHN